MPLIKRRDLLGQVGSIGGALALGAAPNDNPPRKLNVVVADGHTGDPE